MLIDHSLSLACALKELEVGSFNTHENQMAKRSRRDSLSPLSDQLSVGSPSPAVSMTESPPPAKMTELDSDSVDPVVDFIRCSLPPHRDTYTFSSYEEYEVHYAKDHVNRCTECGKNFPTYHFLDLHIEENHDPLLAARKDRGEKTVRLT
jgi:hypothetical protein